MRNYLARLLEHIDAGRPLLEIGSKPVSRDLVTRLVEYFSSPRSVPDSKQEIVHGTNMLMIRTGLVVDRLLDDAWHMILGRKCRSPSDIGPKARLKTPGGYAKFSQKILGRDPSVIEALVRELGEEGFEKECHIRRNTIAPLCALRATPEGVLHFYSGRPNSHPDLPSNGMGVLREYDDGNKVFAGYFTLDHLVDTMKEPTDSVVHGETVVAAVSRYFWNRSELIDMRDRHERATPGGNLLIDPDIRSRIFARVDLPPDKRYPKLSRCRAYCAVPVQARYVFAVRMFLSTDIFLYQEEFSPDEEPLKGFMATRPNTYDRRELAHEFVIDYLDKNYDDILENEIWKKYVRSS